MNCITQIKSSCVIGMKFEMIHMVLLLRIRVGLLLVDALKLSAATMRALPRILDILIALSRSTMCICHSRSLV
jgi:hypothetical protein